MYNTPRFLSGKPSTQSPRDYADATTMGLKISNHKSTIKRTMHSFTWRMLSLSHSLVPILNFIFMMHYHACSR